MQGVIMAAGESSRFWPINHRHKSLFKLMGRPLICHTLESLNKAGIKEVIIIQKPIKDVENELKKYKLPTSLKVKYVIQKKPQGTGHALKSAENFLKDKFLVLNGDDLYGQKDIKKCLSKFPSLLVKDVKNQANFGVIVPRKNCVQGIAEKSKRPPSSLANAGCYFIPKSILKEKIEKSPRGEYEITDYIRRLAKETKLYFFKAQDWIPLSYAWNLLEVNEYFLKSLKTKIAGKVEKNCYLKPPVVIERGTIVKSDAYIEGPVYIGKNCQIRPHSFLRPFTSLGENCVVGQAVELKNSIIGDNSKIGHLSYVPDSVIAENCNLGAGTILADLRFNGKNIQVTVKGRLIDTQRRKLGAIMGKGVKIGINSSLMPGVLLGSDAVIGPHSLVKENVKDNATYFTKSRK